MDEIKEEDVAARCVAMPDCWTHIPESDPPCRVKVDDDGGPTTVTITKDGQLHYDKNAGVQVDTTEYKEGDPS